MLSLSLLDSLSAKVLITVIKRCMTTKKMRDKTTYYPNTSLHIYDTSCLLKADWLQDQLTANICQRVHGNIMYTALHTLQYPIISEGLMTVQTENELRMGENEPRLQERSNWYVIFSCACTPWSASFVGGDAYF